MTRFGFLVACLLSATACATTTESRDPARPPSAESSTARDDAVDGARVALVIGNSKYQHAPPLANPPNDARAMTRVLKRLGFDVLAYEETTDREMRRALADFSSRMRKGGVALFYYSGHAIQVSGKNYLIPVDAELKSRNYVDSETLRVTDLLEKMDEAENQLNIVILDACRNNPFGRRWPSQQRSALARGLAPTMAPPGTFIAYATEPDNVALDGVPGGNGVYTAELLPFLPRPGLKLEDVFKQAAANVLQATQREQRPWISSNFTGDFYFVKPLAAPSDAPKRADLRARVGSLVLLSRAPGVDIWVGETKVWTSREGARYALPNVPVGTHKVLARKAGDPDRVIDVSIAGNLKTEVEVGLDSLGPAKIKSDDGAEMVHIPAGDFAMGDTALELGHRVARCVERSLRATAELCAEWYGRAVPRHQVTLDAYYLDRFEVTNARFERFVQATGHRTTAEMEGHGWSWQQKDGKWQWVQVDSANWRTPNGHASVAESDHPVVHVSWHDASIYCKWAGKRLPTEAEWEKAARGSLGARYPWGDDWDPSHANGVMVVRTTSPVGSYPPGVSPYGVHDMAGNVAEWTADWFDARYYRNSPDQNPAGPESGTTKVMRGGSWSSGELFLGAVDRSDNGPGHRSNSIGFRCARGL